MQNRILLMYITARSGHDQAARALEQGIRLLNPRAEILKIDAFEYLNPILAKIVDRMYLSVVQKLPELWDYLYDNPKVVQRSERLRALLHQYDSPRLKGLLEEFQPQSIACTQAFPCGLVSDHKKEHGSSTPLYGVITDFTPHAYWVNSHIDGYIVPAEESRRWLLDRRVEPSRIHTFGIPIDPRFSEPTPAELVRRRLQLAGGIPTVLLMGGGQGLGPILEAVRALDKMERKVQLLVVAGTNERLYHRLITLVPHLRHPVHLFGHVEFIADLMGVADFIVTKPGGLTTSEALAKGLPIIVLDPIPGQEVKNAHFLTGAKVARQAQAPGDLPRLLSRLLEHPHEAEEMRAFARQLGKPHAAVESARLILGP
ncbi:MAG: glycosyltransferase [Candidatus Omnitrophica bacterium]|nr:glycosyltransferase [Candidatus Omnitrophota bacterium]